jgi:hypothetical protein
MRGNNQRNRTMKYHDPQTGADAKLLDDGTLFVYGTWGKTDVIQDLKVWPTIRKGIIGHRGAFLQAKFLLKALGKDWELVKKIAGHSLGGSVALYLGLWTHLPVITYGAFNPFVFWWRKKYGRTVHVKGKGFHPFTDHLRYKQLKEFGINIIE